MVTRGMTPRLPAPAQARKARTNPMPMRTAAQVGILLRRRERSKATAVEAATIPAVVRMTRRALSSGAPSRKRSEEAVRSKVVEPRAPRAMSPCRRSTTTPVIGIFRSMGAAVAGAEASGAVAA